MQESQMAVFDKLKADVTIFVAPVKEVVVKDAESSGTALSTAKEVKHLLKKVEETRKNLTAPLNEQVKRINAYAKEICIPLEGAEKHLKGELLAYELKLEKIRAEEQAKIEAARVEAEKLAREKADAQKIEDRSVAMFMDSDEVTRNEIIADSQLKRELVDIHKDSSKNRKEVAAMKVSGVQRRWTFEVSDASLVPSEFLVVNEVAVREAIRAGAREIPGIRIYQATGIAI